jgi:hypothetical protein
MLEAGFMKTKAACFLVVILVAAFAAASGWVADDVKIVVFNPRGLQPKIRKIPMTPRQASLDGKTAYIVDTKYPNTKPFVQELLAARQAKYPKTTWVLRDKYAGYMDDDPKLHCCNEGDLANWESRHLRTVEQYLHAAAL